MTRQDAPHAFETTSWSTIRRAARAGSSACAPALSEMCKAYWYPLYAFVRRGGKSAHDAEDLVQGFFARLLEKNTLAAADERKGKFRTFLLSCLQHYLADEHDRAMAGKRGGGMLVSFDLAWAEERYTCEPADTESPDRLFQRRWAMALLESTLSLLGEKYAAQGKTEVFAALRPFLGFGADPEKSYLEISATTGLTVGTLKSEVFRLRQRWRDLLMEQVGRTLDEPSPEEIKEELRALLGSV
jgi:DNA-directed RNA polymerase specialized sigma24 family protein